jgi:hypothetical protein
LASPRTVLWVAPALALPFLALLLIGEDGPPSPIEQTVAALPLPGGQPVPAGPRASGASPFGAAAAASPEVTMPIYNNSAIVLTSQMRVMNADRSDQPAAPLERLDRIDYAELHPADRAKDDLLVGNVDRLSTTPLPRDLSIKIFFEYCTAQPGDPTYTQDALSLPIEHDLLAALEQLSRLSPGSILCPRLADDY